MQLKIKSPGKIFYGWWVLLAGIFVNTLGSGSYQYGFGVFFKPIVEEFGWTRAATSVAFSMSTLEGGLEGPIIGPLIDRFGPRKLIAIGTILLGLGYILLSQINSLLSFYLVYVVVISIGYNTGFHWAAQTAVANWFVRKRTITLGLLSSGQGLGGAIMAPTLAWLLVQMGWRGSLVVVGVAMLVLCLPVAAIVRHRPEQYGMLPDGDPVPPRTSTQRTQEKGQLKEEIYFTVWEALRTRVFWQLAFGFSLRGLSVGAVLVHIIPLLTDHGFDAQVAANIAGLLALMSLPGRIIFGFLGDMFPKRYLLSVNYVLQGVALLLLLRAQTMEEIYLFVFLYGLGWGSSPLMMSIRADYFGRRYFGTISGSNQGLVMLAHVAGPVFAGWIFDVTNSYDVAFILFAATIFLGALTHSFAGPPKPPQRPASTCEPGPTSSEA
ncbi:MAG: MFS transporter [Chloroflexi bacterium]|nr:MFS transporter [Chloroflexota bacterium]